MSSPTVLVRMIVIDRSEERRNYRNPASPIGLLAHTPVSLADQGTGVRCGRMVQRIYHSKVPDKVRYTIDSSDKFDRFLGNGHPDQRRRTDTGTERL